MGKPGFVHKHDNCKTEKIGLKDIVKYINIGKSWVEACYSLSGVHQKTFRHGFQPLSETFDYQTSGSTDGPQAHPGTELVAGSQLSQTWGTRLQRKT